MRGQASLRVLVVEDDGLDFLLIKGALEAMPDWTVHVDLASDAHEGRRALGSGLHDLCLCDYQLGLDHGTDLIRNARERGVRIPILLLTGHDSREVDLAAMKAGATQFMSKEELQPRALERAIRYALQQHATEERLSRLALRDALTGLLNRAGFERHLLDLQDADGRIGRDVGLVYVDLDRFKAVNDGHGHAVGDRLLVAAAQRIRAQLGHEDAAARIGGDEFAVVTQRTPVLESGMRLTEQLRDSLRVAYDLGLATPLSCTASVGMATTGAGRMTCETLLMMADQAMYEAKWARRAEPERPLVN